jgi:hypothetical protein
MAIASANGELRWEYRGMSAPLTHRHYDTFELPEASERLFPDRLAISFFNDREGIITSLSAPLEPLVDDIVFTRIASGECSDPDFRKDGIGTFSHGLTTLVVGQDADGQLTLTAASQHTSKLRPYQGRTFTVVDEGFRIEFRRSPNGELNELIIYHPDGTFVARRV